MLDSFQLGALIQNFNNSIYFIRLTSQKAKFIASINRDYIKNKVVN